MNKLIKALLLLLILIIIIIPGCVPSKPTETVEILSAERLVNKLEANRRRIRTFEGTGTLNIETPQIDNKASFEITLVKPDSIYLSIMGAFGIQLAQTMVTNDSFIFYDELQNNVYEGRLTQDVLKNIFKINLPFSDIIDAFVGSVNLTARLYKQPTKYSVDNDKYILTYVDSATNYTSVYKIDIRTLGIVSFQVMDSDDELVLDCKYSNFDFVENVAVPYAIEVRNIKEDQNVSITYKKMKADNQNIYIDFKVPGDANIIKW